MIKELKFFFFLVITIIFIFFSLKYYFSDENYKNYYRSLSKVDNKINEIGTNLVFLKNDTNDIIEHLELNTIKKKKYSFWELIYNDK